MKYKIHDYVKFTGIQKVGIFTTPLIQDGYIEDVVLLEGVLFYSIKPDSGLHVQVSYPDIISVITPYPYAYNVGSTVRFIGVMKNKPVIVEGDILSVDGETLSVNYDGSQITLDKHFVIGVIV